MKKNLTALIFLLTISSAYSQLNQYKFEQIDSLQKKERRKVVVFFHTDWCKFCIAMQNGTFKNKEIIKKLNQDFYFINFNAEQKQDIVFDNTIYRFKKNGTSSGIHEIALYLAIENKQVNFPSICVFSDPENSVFRYNGFLTALNLMKILKTLKTI